MARVVLDHLSEKYAIAQKRQGLHLSSLIYCLTKAAFDERQGRITPTDEETMLFSLGYGLQGVLTPAAADTPVYEKDGITFSPDMILKIGDTELGEVKTTRASSKKIMAGEFPETWLEYMKAGCFIREQNTYNLIVLCMMGNYSPPFPSIHGFTFSFEDDELFETWDYVMCRKVVLLTNDRNTVPAPYKYCKDWECKGCRYKLVCESIVSASKVK